MDSTLFNYKWQDAEEIKPQKSNNEEEAMASQMFSKLLNSLFSQ